MQATLKAKHHAFVISLMPNKADIKVLNYILQVRKAIGATYDAEADITVDVPDDLVPLIYSTIGQQQERFSARDNAEMQEALMPQLADHPEVAAAIQAIAQENARQTDLIRQSGIDYVMAIEYDNVQEPTA